MTPARRDHIKRVVNFLDAQNVRGHTTPAIREGGPFDGRPELRGAMTDADRCRAANCLQQATYALFIAMSNGEEKDRRTQAAIGFMRTAARDLGFELSFRDDGK